MHAILLHWLCHPAVDTAQAILALLDVQLYKTLVNQVATMLSPAVVLLVTSIKVFYQVWDGATFHFAKSLEGDTLTRFRVEDREVADVGMVAAFLWTDVRVVFILHVRLILADESRSVTVDVVLFWSTSVVFQLRAEA